MIMFHGIKQLKHTYVDVLLQAMPESLLYCRCLYQEYIASITIAIMKFSTFCNQN
jgi:hypothetical protein